jgi:hypothetical protein
LFGVATDKYGNIFYAGECGDGNSNASIGCVTLHVDFNRTDLFFGKYDANGNPVWAYQQLGVPDIYQASGNGIVWTAGDEVVVTANITGAQTLGSISLTFGGSHDIMLAKFKGASANAGSDPTLCRGQSVTLNSLGGGTASWTGPGVNCSNCSSITVNPVVATTYTLSVVNPYGCTPLTDQVTVNMTPATPNFSLKNSSVDPGIAAPATLWGICASYIHLNASATTCETRYWIDVQELDGSTNRTYQYEWGKWVQGEAPIDIDLQSLAASSGDYWINGPDARKDNILIGGNVEVYPFDMRRYRVSICTDQPSWTCKSIVFTVDGTCKPAPTTGVEDLNNTAGLLIFPNPASETIAVSAPKNGKVLLCNLFDLTGRQIKSINNSQGTVNGLTIDVSDVASGNYIIEITTDKGKVKSKVVIQHD